MRSFVQLRLGDRLREAARPGGLLRGQLEVASLAIDELALHLVRTKDGLVLPGRGESPETPPAPEEPAPEDHGGLAFGIREIALSDASLALEDRSAQPAKTWSVADLDLTAQSAAANEPVKIEGSLADVKGDALEVAGLVALLGLLEEIAFEVLESNLKVADSAFTPEGAGF